MFTHSPLNATKFMKMNKACPHCGVLLQPEPGFYQGAMYVQYAFTVVVFLVIGLSLYNFAEPVSDWVYVGATVAAVLLLAPLNYRYSRIIYLYTFGGIKYDPERSN